MAWSFPSTTLLGVESFACPGGIRTNIGDAVMETGVALLPELHAPRDQAIPPPMGGPFHLPVLETRLDPGETAVHGFPARRHFALVGGPGGQLAASGTAVEVGRSGGRVQDRNFTANAQLPVHAVPVKHGLGERMLRQGAPLFGAAVREKADRK